MLYAATFLGVIPPVGLAASSAPCGVRLVLSAAEWPPLFRREASLAAHELLFRCPPIRLGRSSSVILSGVTALPGNGSWREAAHSPRSFLRPLWSAAA